jgi:hypothetical protein
VTRLVVQAGFGHTITTPPEEITWTDITGRVDIADTSPGVTVTRGAADELAETQTGTASLTLDNSDGALTPGNATSPYYPHVKKATPIRIMVVSAGKNLIREGSFEETSPGSSTYSFTGWEDGNPPPFQSRIPDDTHAHHGATAHRITWEPTGDPGIVQTAVYGLTIGEVYTASAWVWVEAGGPPVRLQIDGDAALGTASATSGAWEQITVTWTATAAVHTLQITATSLPTTADMVWLDEVQVEEGSSPTAFDDDFAVLHERFYGMVNQWPTRWRGLYAEATITCSDVFKWLSEQPELQPMLVEEVLRRSPLAYYPLSEPADSTTAGDLSGTTAGAAAITQVGSGGTLEFGSEEAAGPPSDGLPVPVFTPASSTAGRYLAADLGQDYATLSSQNYLYMECWFATTSTSRTIFALTSETGRYKIRFGLDSFGWLVIEWTTAGIWFNSYVAGTGALNDGQPHHLVYDEFNQRIYIDGGTGLTVTVDLMYELRHLTVGASYDATGLWNGTISHLALYAPDSGAPGWYTSHYTTGMTAHEGETTDVRMARIATYVDLDVTAVGTAFDGVSGQGELGSTPMQHMREIETTESGRLLADRASNALVFQSRDVRYNPTPVATLDWADLETGEAELADDDQKQIVTVVASRPGGATVRVVDKAARARYGPYQRNLTLFKDSDLAVVDAANWLVQRYADPEPEIRQVPVEVYSLPLATYRALLDADVSTAITLTGLPDEAPASVTTVTVEGYTETIHHNRHALDFHTSRTDVDSVWVLDDPVYSQLGVTTRLAY